MSRPLASQFHFHCIHPSSNLQLTTVLNWSFETQTRKKRLFYNSTAQRLLWDHMTLWSYEAADWAAFPDSQGFHQSATSSDWTCALCPDDHHHQRTWSINKLIWVIHQSAVKHECQWVAKVVSFIPTGLSEGDHKNKELSCSLSPRSKSVSMQLSLENKNPTLTYELKTGKTSSREIIMKIILKLVRFNSKLQDLTEAAGSSCVQSTVIQITEHTIKNEVCTVKP